MDGVHVVGIDGAGDRRISPASPDPAVQFVDADPVLSPDATRLAYVRTGYRCIQDGCSNDGGRLVIADLVGHDAMEVSAPQEGVGSPRQWSPDGERLLLGSIGGVVSVGLAPGGLVAIHSPEGELNLEWSGDELTWQPAFGDPAQDGS